MSEKQEKPVTLRIHLSSGVHVDLNGVIFYEFYFSDTTGKIETYHITFEDTASGSLVYIDVNSILAVESIVCRRID